MSDECNLVGCNEKIAKINRGSFFLCPKHRDEFIGNGMIPLAGWQIKVRNPI